MMGLKKTDISLTHKNALNSFYEKKYKLQYFTGGRKSFS